MQAQDDPKMPMPRGELSAFTGARNLKTAERRSETLWAGPPDAKSGPAQPSGHPQSGHVMPEMICCCWSAGTCSPASCACTSAMICV